MSPNTSWTRRLNLNGKASTWRWTERLLVSLFQPRFCSSCLAFYFKVVHAVPPFSLRLCTTPISLVSSANFSTRLSDIDALFFTQYCSFSLNFWLPHASVVVFELFLASRKIFTCILFSCFTSQRLLLRLGLSVFLLNYFLLRVDDGVPRRPVFSCLAKVPGLYIGVRKNFRRAF